MTATQTLCPCGKAATHVNADEESAEWPCRVPPVESTRLLTCSAAEFDAIRRTFTEVNTLLRTQVLAALEASEVLLWQAVVDGVTG